MVGSDSPLSLPTQDLSDVLDAVGHRWEALRGQRILLTGGTGFIGKWLLGTFLHANRSLKLDARIVVLSRNVAAFQARFPTLVEAGEIEWLQGDVRDFSLREGQSCSFAIHAATDVAANSSPQEILDTCVAGTTRLLRQMSQQTPSRVLLLSSGAVYGRPPSDSPRFSEDWRGAPDCLTPASAYGEGKRVSELLTTIFAAKNPLLNVTIARCFAFVGPHLPLDKHFAIGNFIASAMRDENILIEGDGTPLRSYLYAADLAHWLWILLFDGANMRAYNVGGDESLSIAELAKRVNQALGATGLVRIARQPEPGTQTQAYLPALNRIATELSLQPRITLDEAIRRTALWASQHTV